MKRLLAVAVASFALAGSAFAATPVAEPSLPPGIATWEKNLAVCTKHTGKTISQESYVHMSERSLMKITVIRLNGQKVAQAESVKKEVVGIPIHTFVQYVKNSPGENWLAYAEKELGDAYERFFAEVGLTQEEFGNACGE